MAGGQRAGANSPSDQVPAGNGGPISNALVLHQIAAQPVSQSAFVKPSEQRSLAPDAENVLALVSDRHDVCLREEAEVARILSNLVISAEGYKVQTPNRPWTQQLAAVIMHSLLIHLVTLLSPF